jgi:hypothetical protein
MTKSELEALLKEFDILEMLGSEERTLVFHSPTADKVRRLSLFSAMVSSPALTPGLTGVWFLLRPYNLSQ